MRILVTGATGYIGGRLVPRLLDAGHEVRCVARNPQKLSLYPWRHRVEVAGGDVLDERAIKDALVGCDAAVYLVHSMSAGKDFSRLDRRTLTFRSAAADAGIRRIVYLELSAPRASPDPAICAVATRLATSLPEARRQ